MEKLKIAIQKSGRLSEKSIELLKECGIKVSNSDRKLKSSASNFPMEVLFLRDDDIPQYVEQGVADIGILGENEVWEKEKDVKVVEKLGFAHCRLSLAIPRDEEYTCLLYTSKYALLKMNVSVSSRSENIFEITGEPIVPKWPIATE